MNEDSSYWGLPTYNGTPITELTYEQFLNMLDRLLIEDEDFKWFKKEICPILNKFFQRDR